MNGRKEIRKIKSNHHCLTGMRRRVSHGIATLAKSMHVIVWWNPFKQTTKNLALYAPQARLRNFDQPTSSVALLNRLVGVVVKWRACTLRHNTPAICEPLKIDRLDFQPGGQIAEGRQLRQRNRTQPRRWQLLCGSPAQNLNDHRPHIAAPCSNETWRPCDKHRHFFTIDTVPARTEALRNLASRSPHPFRTNT